MTSGESVTVAGPTGTVFSIERYAVHDGSGIRTMVYLKGCPLRCVWCANPEGQVHDAELIRFPERCIACDGCAAVCASGAAGIEPMPEAVCARCGRCAAACPADARKLFGREMTVAAVMEEVLKDRAFYRRSGGGVTLSGGEPAAQPAFAHAVLSACHAHGLDTAIETCGYAAFAQLALLAAECDEVLFDLKHMDSDTHRRLTGVGNELILENVRRLTPMAAVRIRVPVIPGYNDGADHLAALAGFASRLAPVPEIELLPYHNYGSAKYARAGRVYALSDVALPTAEQMHALAAVVQAAGVPCSVG